MGWRWTDVRWEERLGCEWTELGPYTRGSDGLKWVSGTRQKQCHSFGSCHQLGMRLQLPHTLIQLTGTDTTNRLSDVRPAVRE